MSKFLVYLSNFRKVFCRKVKIQVQIFSLVVESEIIFHIVLEIFSKVVYNQD